MLRGGEGWGVLRGVCLIKGAGVSEVSRVCFFTFYHQVSPETGPRASSLFPSVTVIAPLLILLSQR